MELITDKSEARILKPDEVWKRLMDFYNEMDDETTEVEFQNANWYLDSALSILDKRFLNNKVSDKHPNSPCFHLAQAAAFAYDCLALVDYRRCYQKALLIWLHAYPSIMRGSKILNQKEIKDRKITNSLARVIGGRTDDSLTDVPQLLERTIQKARENKDDAMVCKATVFLSVVKETLTARQDEQKSIGIQQRFLEELADYLKGYEVGKVKVKTDCIELITNDSKFPFNLESLIMFCGDKSEKLKNLVEVYTKIAADDLGINSDRFTIKPVIFLRVKGLHKNQFFLIIKKQKKLKKIKKSIDTR